MNSGSKQPPTFGHLKPRYSFNKVCRIFGVHADTLHRWLREGVPLGNGRRTHLRYIQLGPRKKEFDCEEVERVFTELSASTADEQ
jgi:predicted site-specific integrase-resolvase